MATGIWQYRFVNVDGNLEGPFMLVEQAFSPYYSYKHPFVLLDASHFFDSVSQDDVQEELDRMAQARKLLPIMARSHFDRLSKEDKDKALSTHEIVVDQIFSAKLKRFLQLKTTRK